MTRDTKIGLLLGLVFIFIIAVLINGLPRIRARSTTHTAKPPVPSPTSPGLGVREQMVRRWANNEPVYTRSLDSHVPSGDASGVDIRAVMPLPPGLGSPGQTQTQTATPELTAGSTTSMPSHVSQVSVDTKVPAGQVLSGPSQVESTTVRGLPNTATASSTDTASTVAKTASEVRPAQTLQTGQWPKTYLVKAGDTLEGIAKKMYGPQDGLKRVNIMRIFEANRSVLDSPQTLRIGQQLTIPEPASGTTQKPSQSIATTSKVSSIVGASDRWYTVHEGDSLWKIAATQLGNGNRYAEILKLNQDQLKGREDQLQVGMRLRLPPK